MRSRAVQSCLRELLQLVRAGILAPSAVEPLLRALSDRAQGAGEARGEIAVIGLAGSFPGAADIPSYWRMLRDGRDGVAEIPASRWDWRDFFSDRPSEKKSYSKWAGLLDGIELFDPSFFNISYREALAMDPQQRWFLKVAWHALEDGGYAEAGTGRTRCGVFAGCKQGDYRNLLGPSATDIYGAIGCDTSILSARISYLLDLAGPAITVDTACSSSLTAVALACNSLCAGVCEIAIAGGVSALCTPELHISLSQSGMLSPTGRCRTFDAMADGFVPAEAAGAVLLKPLEKAREDGDHIYAVIEAWGLNQDGRTNGITAPNGVAQAALLRDTYRRFGIKPETIGYIETHGTGTQLGDPIELQGLATAFREFTEERRFCAIGSVKTNIGHALASAGIAGLLKTIGCMEYGELFPSIHYGRPNPMFDLSATPFRVVTEKESWEATGQPRRAAVSSFGFSGTNVHVVIREGERAPAGAGEPGPWLFPLSARSEAALAALKARMAEWVDEERPVLRDTSFTLMRGRGFHECREVFLAATHEQLRRGLRGAGPVESGASQPEGVRRWLDGERNAFAEMHAALLRSGARRIAVPGYVFQELAFWPQAAASEAARSSGAALAPVGERSLLRLSRHDPILRDHVVEGRATVPAVFSLGLAIQESGSVLPVPAKKLRDVTWTRPMVAQSADLEMRLRWKETQAGDRPFAIESSEGVHVEGIAESGSAGAAPSGPDIQGLKRRLSRPIFADEVYASFRRRGFAYGAALKGIKELWRGETEALALLCRPAVEGVGAGFPLSVGMLDGALQTLLGLDVKGADWPPVPFSLGAFTVYGPMGDECYAWLRLTGRGADWLRFDIDLLDMDGGVLLRMERLTVRPLRGNPRVAEEGQLEVRLKRALARETGLAEDQIAVRENFAHFGIDSMMALSITRELEETFGELPKTLFFEFNTISSLAAHLRERFPDAARRTSHEAVVESSEALGAVEAERRTAGLNEFGRGVEPIAIVGMVGRFPGAANLDQFWENLRAGRDSITEIPAERWDHGKYYDARRGQPGKTCSRWGGFLEGVDLFDPLLFRISPREAEVMDPQERLFLETAWETAENAGYAPRDLAGRAIGVYAGAMYTQYQLFGAEAGDSGAPMALNSSQAAIANRVSYCLDLHGPSIGLDTMCSSALTAIHMACAALRSEEIEAAFAGGVNLTLHPQKYLLLSQANVASSDGRCRSFGAGGDGYVPGEGVGVVLLKTLRRAVADGDTVQGVIRGSAVNHGGLANGFTVPSVPAQAEVMRECLRRAGVDPRRVSYIEAHGTGTSLGDPIEMAALEQVYGGTGSRDRPCAIGSVKSNIGHLESAAGMAGIAKVLLQMHHRELAPSLHAETINPNLKFAPRVFYLQRERSAWAANQDGLPRMAGISSFGAGGANAHVLIEEYRAQALPETHEPQVLPLSARTPELLRDLCVRMARFAEAGGNGLRLEDVAFTLQCGRQVWSERIAVVASTFEEWAGAMRAWLAGSQLRANGNWAETVNRWIEGGEVDFAGTRTGSHHRRVPLPASGFLRERCWAPKAWDAKAEAGTGVEEGTRIAAKVESGWIDDHVVQGHGVLPAAAALSLFQAAAGALSGLALREIRWLRPAVFNGTRGALEIERSGERWSLTKDNLEVAVAERGPGPTGMVPDSGPRVDVQAVRARLTNLKNVSGHYGEFEQLGLKYGSTFRVLEELRPGTGEVFAALRYRGSEKVGPSPLEPALIDGGLQAVAAMEGRWSAGAPPLPASLRRLFTYRPLSADPLVYARVAREDPHAFDVDYCTRQGEVCVRLEGLRVEQPRREMRPLQPLNNGVGISAEGVFYFEPQWVVKEGEPGRLKETIVCDGSRQGTENAALLGRAALTVAAPESLEAARRLVSGWQTGKLAGSPVVFLAADDGSGVHGLLRLVRALLEQKPIHLREILYLHSAGMGGAEPANAAVAALARTLEQETPKLKCRVVEYPLGSLSQVLARELGITGGGEVAYRHGQRLVRVLRAKVDGRDADLESANGKVVSGEVSSFRRGGVYLITGGRRGIGLAVAEHLARNYAARLILVGRSERESDHAAIERLREIGAEVLSVLADIALAAGAREAVRLGTVRFGRIDGVIHSAGVLRDGFLLSKTEDQFDAVAAPKVAGVRNLFAAFEGHEPEFVALLSSLAAVAGNSGQSDYAYANAFLDHWAEQWTGPAHVVSINWPYWREGGMQLSERAREQMRLHSGLTALETADGMKALEYAIGCGARNVAVASGDGEKLNRFFNVSVRTAATTPGVSAIFGAKTKLVAMRNDRVRSDGVRSDKFRSTRDKIAAKIGQVLKLAPERIKADQPLTNFGMDSVAAMEIAGALEEDFGPQPDTLLFEYPTLEAVAAHLAAGSLESLAAGEDEPVAASGPDQNDIAIVGLAGRYPFAESLEELWRFLADGRDGVTEIPSERWNYRDWQPDGEQSHGTSGCRWGSFLAGWDRFDPRFFGITRREAALMDPHERIFLEVAWHALEDAALTRRALAGQAVGVFAGVMWSQYQLYGDEALRQGQALPASSFSSIANRLSYFGDFNGPSLAVDTMCSSSLTAIHLAVQSLLRGECRTAIAGGVNLTLHPHKYVLLSQGKFVSTTGRCRSFGPDADGYVPGEGAGVVVLKRLTDALADGDPIRAVIKATAMNHGGRSGGYSVPNPQAQAALLSKAWQAAGGEPVSYVEAHGTGTALGDPLEVAGIREAMRASGITSECRIGSIKSNLGHLEAAAGVAGLTKVILQLEKGQLVPSLYADPCSTRLDFGGLPLSVQTRLEEWPRRGGTARRAGVSSFGAGGTNTHVVVEEFVAREQERAVEVPRVVVLSARSSETLKAFAAALADFVERQQVSLDDVSWTLQVGREAWEERAAFVAGGREELLEGLRDLAASGTFANGYRARNSQNGGGEVALDYVEARDLNEIARAWTQGAEVDWREAWHGAAARRVALPGYRFAQERHWFSSEPRPEGLPGVANNAKASRNRERVEALLGAVTGLTAEEIDPDANFADLGIDSVLQRELIADLEKEFGKLPATLLWEFPTMASLTTYLDRCDSNRDNLPVTGVEPASEFAPAIKPLPAMRTPREGISDEEPIAVIGVHGRYPGGEDLESFWERLHAGQSAIGPVPEGRWRRGSYENLPCQLGAFLNEVDCFDPYLFGITPAEAAQMNPEERLLLESAWACLEDAGYARASWAGRRIGVYVGATTNTYPMVAADAAGAQGAASPDASTYSLANRISYTMDWTGPSLTVDTACSSALVAIHMACESIRREECESALAAAVNLYLHPSKYARMAQGNLLASEAPRGLFDRSASGFVPGEGVGSILLKPLAAAQRDGDVIHGVIRATAVRHKGRSNGFLAPRAGAQQSVIEETLEEAGLNASGVSYLELQATGAAGTDAMEFEALRAVFPRAILGSAKPVIGHLEGASGMAAVAKLLLQFRHREVPGVAVAEKRHAEVRLEDTALRVPTKAESWEGEFPQRGGIGSFGVGGVNAFMVIEEPPARALAKENHEAQLVVLSAKTPERLIRLERSLGEYLDCHPETRLDQLAWTLQTGREHLAERAGVVVKNATDLREALREGRLERRRAGNASEAAIKPCDRDWAAALRFWLAGGQPDWADLHGGVVPGRISLPHYPFERVRCWIDTPKEAQDSISTTNAVASYYDTVAANPSGEVPMLTFAPFPAMVPGFQWLRAMAGVEFDAEFRNVTRKRQLELRSAAFRRVDWARVERVLDIGCGLGADLVRIAEEHPNVQLDGFTISALQAESCRRTLIAKGPGERCRIHHADSSTIAFPHRYDLIYGFEVSFHIEKKTALFDNIAKHLNPGGKVILIDTVATTVTPLAAPHLGQFTSNEGEWAQLLAGQGLRLSSVVDASAEVANFLDDPDFETHLSQLSAASEAFRKTEREHRGWHQFGVMLVEGLVRYMILEIEADAAMPRAALEEWNLRQIRAPKAYGGAEAEEQAEEQTEAAGHLERMTAIASEVLGIPLNRLDLDQPFGEYGVTSLIGLRLLERINRVLDARLEMPLLYSAPTLRLLARQLAMQSSAKPSAENIAKTSAASPLVDVAAPVENLGKDEIAVIGMAGRFPGARNAAEFWKNLAAGLDAVTEVPPERWNWRLHFDADPSRPGRTYCRWGGFLDGADEFDAAFFRIAPAEAEVTDPQQRLFLETCWHALDDAGYGGERAHGKRCGVMVGALESDFGQRLRADENPTRVAHGMLGNAPSILAARIAYFLNLKGPAVAINTACSSSLVGVHLACQSLRNGETDMMLAGGVSFYPDEGPFILMSKAGMLSPSGRCRTFDAGADGIVVGEAVAAVVLKRLCDAVKDGDVIYGVIAGSGMNQDGTTNGLTAPNGDAQRDLALDVMRRAGVDASQVSFIECHGTGTRLGDPVEVRAIGEAYGNEGVGEHNRCALGSVKSNVGHASAAAGIVGLIKVLLGMRFGQIPATLHIKTLNPLLVLEGSRFQVNTDLSPWIPNGPRRVAALNSFGYSGTNATVLVTEYAASETSRRPEESGPFLIPLSAKDADGLERLKKGVAAWLVEEGDGVDGIEACVTEIVSETLSLPIDALTSDTRFEELGWDAHQISLSARRLEQTLHVKVTPAALAEAGSVGELARRFRPRQYRRDLAAIAAAMQCDRAVLPHRVAYIASSTEELYNQLLGEVRTHATGGPGISAKYPTEDMFARRDWAGLAAAWESGHNVDWRALWRKLGDGLPRERARLLPPYPFARRAYPLPPRSGAYAVGEARLGELTPKGLDSDLLRDHRIFGEEVLPGAATLCAAMAAARRRSPHAGIEDFIWRAPHLDAGIDAKIEGGIVLLSSSSGGVSAQCRVKTDGAGSWSPESYPALTLRESATKRLDKAAIYGLFAQHGLAYGESLQVVEELSVCDGGLLARIELPGNHASDARFLDGAFQAVLAAFREQDQSAYIPFSLEAAAWNHPLPESGYAWVERRMDQAHTFDISLLASDGATIGSLRGLCLRAFEKPKQAESQESELLYASSRWELRSPGGSDFEAPEVWLLRGFRADECAAIRAAAPAGVDVVEHGIADAPDGRQPRRVLFNLAGNAEVDLMELFSTALELRAAKSLKLIALVDRSSGEAPPPFNGAMRSLALEFPNWTCCVLEIDKHQAGWPAIVVSELKSGEDAMVRRMNDKREVLVVRPATASSRFVMSRGIERKRKTWLITGATGALGQLTARHLVSRGPVNLVLTGRRQLDAWIVEGLRTAGANVFFQSADLSIAGQIADVVCNARLRFGAIHGWIHAAGVSQAQRAECKSAAQIAAVLATKVTGAMMLDEVLRKDPLERIVLFSSVASAFGDFGQADYAFANAWLDQFAAERHPVAISIRWPVLAGGGMQIPEATRRFLAESHGLEPLPDNLFRNVLDQAIDGGDSLLMPLYGNRDKLRLLLSPSPTIPPVLAPAAAVNGRDDKVQEILCAAVAAITHIDLREIDPVADLRDFGLDSIGYTELANELNRKLGARATPALFFEARNLKAVARAVGASLAALLPGDFPEHAKAIPTADGIMDKPATEAVKAPLLPSKQMAHDAIAVIGMAGRYPGADDLEEYWQRLNGGEDLVSEVPADRWRRAQSEDSVPHQGGFLRDVSSFDAEFFGISPREAALMDPQQRLFLETVWATIENAGYMPSSLAGSSTGVFVGVANMDYANLMARSGVPVEAHATTGVSHAILANRVSFLLDLRGPSEPIDTACSSSLVAVHRAVEAIRSGSCVQAIAGGVNVLLSQDLFVSFAQAGMLSPTGRCRTFDASADGYVRGEGVGAVFLKPLERALQEGDHVLAVIRGSGESHNGRANGLTAPNGEGQTSLLVRTYERADVDPASIGYVEAHGTATPIGDPVECNALREAFNKLRAGRGEPELPTASCPLGSVKSNIGHLETAAGIAGLHKVILALRNHRIPPTLHVSEVNPYLQLDKGPFYLATDGVDWPRVADGPRRAGVSSFGFGGANAHLIVEEAPEAATAEAAVRTRLFVLSARSQERLRTAARLLEAHVERRMGDLDLERLAFTLQTGREAMTHRLAILADTSIDLCRQLNGVASGEAPTKAVFLGSAKSGIIAMEDEEGRAFARALWNKDRLDQLGRLWVSGANLDWDSFYDGRRPLRTEVPAYPFERTRHWFAAEGEAAEPKSAPQREQPPVAVPKIQLRRAEETQAEAKLPLDPLRPAAKIAQAGSNGHTGTNGQLGPNGNAGKNGHSTANAHAATNGFAAANPNGYTNGHVSTNEHFSSHGKSGTNGHHAAAHATEVRAAIRKQLAKVLFMEEAAIDEGRPFVELGLDSILAVELVRFLNRTYGIDLKTSRLFDCPTVAALGKRVAELSSERDEPMAQDVAGKPLQGENQQSERQPAGSAEPDPGTGRDWIRERIATRLREVRQ